MRKKIVAGNWKMNLSILEGNQLVSNCLDQMPSLEPHQQVIFCTPFVHLMSIAENISFKPMNNVLLGAQNCHDKSSGAYTGEISIAMLQEVGVKAVIIGHSERRQYFNESNEFLKSKVDALVASDMTVLICCGEPLEIREANTQNDYVKKQIEESLFHLSPAQIQNNIVIAYEPIWAIGTGKTASSDQAQEMHAYIRSIVSDKYGTMIADSLAILYGGSCNANNAEELFSCADVDGGLIGGAALKAETFIPIIAALK